MWFGAVARANGTLVPLIRMTGTRPVMTWGEVGQKLG